ncbi:MAG: CCA tRNA nucleotidyltransferase [Desulfobacterales bacterium]|nr:MAG: CCA tRNA nucleotidyltransferase [Desulfobacterales bacterium]
MAQFNINSLPKTKGVYVVGGSLRDLLLGRTPSDYDIVVCGDPQEFALQVARSTAGRLVALGKPGRRIWRVVTLRHIFDISSTAGRSIEEDLRQRDFTVNALAHDLYSANVIDCTGGRQDLAHKIVRMISPNIFQDDPVRLLRAYRLAATLGFTVEPQTEAAIGNEAHLIRYSAGERIREELFKIFRTANSFDYIGRMASGGLLFAILPELLSLQNCRQNIHHQYDVWGHTLRAYEQLEQLLKDTGRATAGLTPGVSVHMDPRRQTLLKWALLLHDIGKPAVQTADADGGLHFYGHDRKGAEMARAICHRLRLATRDTDYTELIVRHHSRPLFLFQAAQKRPLTPKALTKFFMQFRNYVPDLLLHAVADGQGKGDPHDRQSQAFVAFALQTLAEFQKRFKPREALPPLLNGNDLIEEFNLVPSPLFRTLLNLVEEERLSRQRMNRREALELVRSFLQRTTAG